MHIKDKFTELFNMEMNDDNVNMLLKKPVKKESGIFQMLNSWKKYHTTDNDLEERALTLIFLKHYNYFKEK